MATETKSGFHYGWLIFIGCCCLAAGSMALTVSIIGVYLLPASARLGISPGDFATWATVSGFVSVVALPFWGQFLPKHCRACFAMGSIALIVCILLFAFAPSLPVVIIGGVFCGIQMPILFTVGIPSIMGQWFVGKQKAKFLGIATAFSGVGTFVWAPLFTVLVQNTGVEGAYIVNAVLAAVLTLPFCFFVFRWDPAEKGLQPIGAEEGNPEADANVLLTGVSASQAMKSAAFWVFIVAVALLAIGMGYNNSQPVIANFFLSSEIGADAAALLGASMISAAAVGNIVGKIVFGFVSDRLGARVTNVAFICLSLIAMMMWVFTPNNVAYIVAGFLFGTNNAVASVGFPIICRDMFGDKDYSKIWSRLCMASALLGGSATQIVNYIAEGTGSFVNAIYVGFLLYIIVILFLLIAINVAKKLKKDTAPTAETQA